MTKNQREAQKYFIESIASSIKNKHLKESSYLSEDDLYDRYQDIYDEYGGAVYPDVAEMDYRDLPSSVKNRIIKLGASLEASFQSLYNNIEELHSLHEKYIPTSKFIKDDIMKYFLNKDKNGKGYEIEEAQREAQSWINTFDCIDKL